MNLELKDAGRNRARGAADIVVPVDAAARQTGNDTPEGVAALNAIVLATAKRDRSAFEALYEATVDRVLGLATRIVGDVHAADDVASDVYLQIWRQADKFDPARGSAIAWIMTMCRSRALDVLRRLSVAASHAAEMAEQPVDDDANDGPHDLLLATDRSSSVHRALEQLEPSDRQLLTLAYFRGYTHSQLAEIVGQPLGTVKTRIRRTLIKVKEMLIDDGMEVGEET